MTTSITAEQLSNVAILAGWSVAELEQLISHGDSIEFPEEAEIVKEGAEERALFFIVAGCARVNLHVTHVGEELLAEMPAGSMFGEVSFFHPAPHSATIKSVEPVRLLKLSRMRYEELKNENNTIALRLGACVAELLAERLHHTNAWLAEHLTRQEDRLIHEKWVSFRSRVGNAKAPSGGFRVM